MNISDSIINQVQQTYRLRRAWVRSRLVHAVDEFRDRFRPTATTPLPCIEFWRNGRGANRLEPVAWTGPIDQFATTNRYEDRLIRDFRWRVNGFRTRRLDGCQTTVRMWMGDWPSLTKPPTQFMLRTWGVDRDKTDDYLDRFNYIAELAESHQRLLSQFLALVEVESATEDIMGTVLANEGIPQDTAAASA
jgi:hypothetical protein